MQCSCHAQISQKNLSFDRISVDQGLSQSAVTGIVQDKEGFMWFGTHNGLNRYDGYKFVIYKHSETNSNSLSDNDINGIYTEKGGDLWIITRGGLDRFNRETETFTHFKNIPGIPFSLNSLTVKTIYEDRAGELYIGTGGHGLLKFDKTRKHFKIYKKQPKNNQSISDDWVTSVLEDSYGVIWVGTASGLNRFDKNTGKFTRNPLINTAGCYDWITTIYEDHSRNLWIGTAWCENMAEGLNRFVREKNKFIPAPITNLWGVNSIVGDSDDWLWIATDGLVGYNVVTNDFVWYKNNPQNTKSLSFNNITSLAIDKSGSLWVGTFGGGINKVNMNPPNFLTYQHEAKNNLSINSTSIRAIYEDDEGMLWLGGYGGMDKMNRKTSSIKHYTTTPHREKKYNLNNPNVYVIIGDKENKDILWLGHEGGGLSKFNKKTNQFIHYPQICDQAIFAMLDGKDGFLWVGTANGLCKLNKRTMQSVSYHNDPKNKNSLSDNRIKVIIKDKKGILWIGTDNGLNSFDEKTNTFTQYLYNPNDTNSLSNNLIIGIYEDRSGNLWIGTRGGGLNLFDRQKKLFKSYDERNGLPNDVVYSILEDDDKNLWLSTNNGISRFSPSSHTFKNFYHNDGLQSDEFNQGAYFKSKTGELFFGGINGVSAFYPQRLKGSNYIAPIVITSFKKFNTDFKFSKNISALNQMELSYKDQVISFEFAALDFTLPEKNQYAYMMEGFDKDWIYSGNKHEATYTNLDPGEYTFKVKGTNRDGVWNEKGAAIKINIIPPWWKTWWFRISGVLAMGLGVYLLFRFRIRQIKKRNILLEAQVEQRTHELSEINRELEKLSIVARETANGVFITDAQGNLEWFNEGFSKLFGWNSVEEYIKDRGKNIFDVSGNKNIKEIVNESIREKKSVIYDAINPTKEGKKLWMQATLTPIFDEGGVLRRLVFVDSDITELKKSEEQLLSVNKELEAFSYSVSHDLRTPLRAINGYSKILQEDYAAQLDSDAMDALTAILNNSKKMGDLIDDLLTFSRLGRTALTITEINMAEVVQSVIEEEMINKSNEIEFTVNELPPAKGTIALIRQVWINLISNAIKYSKYNPKAHIEIGSYYKDRFIVYYVKDNGAGFDMKYYDKLFGVFQRLHSQDEFQGTGIGLAIVQKIIHRHHGSVWAESTLNEGTTFYFSLPTNNN